MDFLRKAIEYITQWLTKVFRTVIPTITFGDKKGQMHKKIEDLVLSNEHKKRQIDELEADLRRKKEQMERQDQYIEELERRGHGNYELEEMEGSEETTRGSSSPPLTTTAGTDMEEEMGEEMEASEEEQKYTMETVLFGTNRNQKGSAEKIKFGNDSDTLKYGKCEISIPVEHEIGRIERPFMGLKFLEDEDSHIVIQETKLINRDAFEDLLCTQIANDDKKKAFLFIHGYNSSFEAAARRTAQMKHDMKFKGAAIFYSWPSSGSKEKYNRDGEMTLLSESHLKNFILSVLHCAEVESLYIIGHSMGNRPLCNVVKEIIEMDEKYRSIIREVILTAPDVNAEIFINDIVPAFNKHDQKITLYTSSNDYALKLSRQVNGFRRAGEFDDDFIIMKGVETIDASEVDTNLVDVAKHSYFGSNRSVINDIVNLVVNEQRPDDRFDLKKIVVDKGEYWTFRTGG